MRSFEIDAEKLYWLNNADDPDALCLHGDVIAKIGDKVFERSATVSSTALYLLKTFSQFRRTI